MTEDEAKTKWCFHFIASHTDPRQPQSKYGIEQGLPGPFLNHCIGSDCMAWRAKNTHIRETSMSQQRPTGDGWCLDMGERRWFRYVDDLSGGYCGLAGAPA